MSLAVCVIAQLFAFCWKFGETLRQRKELKNYAIITISSFYIRSEKEALKKRKKRTPTVAMTTEQYKAKRGILNSTPKKTGKCWKNIFLQMVVCVLPSHSKMHVWFLIFTFQGADCMRSQWKSFLSISKEHFRPSLQLLCKRNPGNVDFMISRNGILVKNLEFEPAPSFRWYFCGWREKQWTEAKQQGFNSCRGFRHRETSGEEQENHEQQSKNNSIIFKIWPVAELYKK